MLKFPCACNLLCEILVACWLVLLSSILHLRSGRGEAAKARSVRSFEANAFQNFGVSGKIILRWALHNMSICGIWWDMNRVATITRMPFISVEVPTLFIAMISGPSVAYCVLSECLMCHVSNFDWFRLTLVLDDLTSDCLLSYHTKIGHS